MAPEGVNAMPDCVKPNGNCTEDVDPDDKLAVQCVGSWAKDKHDYFRRYLEATAAVRAKFLPPVGRGGAGLVDLFAGPGRARVDSPREFIDGSPLIALHQQVSPFTRILFCDIDDENVDALEKRNAALGGLGQIRHGDCNAMIDEIVADVPEYGYNVALIDPYAASNLSFATVARLSTVKRMDLIIHFPLGSMKRNFSHRGHIENFLGLAYDDWGVEVNSGADVVKLLEVYRKQLETLGYPKNEVRIPAIRNTNNLPLYHLVFASKSTLGEKIWNSITKRDRHGQGSLF